MIEHVIEGCTCEGKKCTKCKEIRCVGQYTKDKRLRSGLKSKCRICSHTENKQWRENNREYDMKRKRTWEAENPEKYHAQRERRYSNLRRARYPRILMRLNERERKRLESLDMRLRRKRLTDEERKTYEREYNKQFYHQNREYHYKRVMDYFHSHPGYRATIEANRRARKRSVGGSYTYQEWLDLKAKYDYTCLCCGKREPEIQLHADHVTPVIKGGSSYIDNIQPLCKSCNSSKGRKILDFRPQNP